MPGTPFWLSPASYWMPKHYPASAWKTHAPFAAWLVDVVRPNTIIELGTHRGFSCFAFAEAAKRFGLDTSIVAIDSWQGDVHAGHYGPEVYEYVRGVVAADYADQVTMTRGYFGDSRHLFADGSADILHIDGRHFYDDALSDYTTYVSVVRDGGIVLFHDIAEHAKDFGVWKLWEEIAEPGRSFAFDHGHGLGVLAVGTVPDGPLGRLFAADEQTKAAIRADYERLGAAVARQSELESLAGDASTFRAQRAERTANERQLRRELRAQSAQNERMLNSTSWRITAPLRWVGSIAHRK